MIWVNLATKVRGRFMQLRATGQVNSKTVSYLFLVLKLFSLVVSQKPQEKWLSTKCTLPFPPHQDFWWISYTFYQRVWYVIYEWCIFSLFVGRHSIKKVSEKCQKSWSADDSSMLRTVMEKHITTYFRGDQMQIAQYFDV